MATYFHDVTKVSAHKTSLEYMLVHGQKELYMERIESDPTKSIARIDYLSGKHIWCALMVGSAFTHRSADTRECILWTLDKLIALSPTPLIGTSPLTTIAADCIVVNLHVLSFGMDIPFLEGILSLFHDHGHGHDAVNTIVYTVVSRCTSKIVDMFMKVALPKMSSLGSLSESMIVDMIDCHAIHDIIPLVKASEVNMNRILHCLSEYMGSNIELYQEALNIFNRLVEAGVDPIGSMFIMNLRAKNKQVLYRMCTFIRYIHSRGVVISETTLFDLFRELCIANADIPYFEDLGGILESQGMTLDYAKMVPFCKEKCLARLIKNSLIPLTTDTFEAILVVHSKNLHLDGCIIYDDDFLVDLSNFRESDTFIKSVLMAIKLFDKCILMGWTPSYYFYVRAHQLKLHIKWSAFSRFLVFLENPIPGDHIIDEIVMKQIRSTRITSNIMAFWELLPRRYLLYRGLYLLEKMRLDLSPVEWTYVLDRVVIKPESERLKRLICSDAVENQQLVDAVYEYYPKCPMTFSNARDQGYKQGAKHATFILALYEIPEVYESWIYHPSHWYNLCVNGICRTLDQTPESDKQAVFDMYASEHAVYFDMYQIRSMDDLYTAANNLRRL